jgi:hypothetical protein
LKSKAESISRQLRGWADSLQESPITGQRYLTEKSRRISRQRQDREDFLKELQQFRAGHTKPSNNGISVSEPVTPER